MRKGILTLSLVGTLFLPYALAAETVKKGPSADIVRLERLNQQNTQQIQTLRNSLKHQKNNFDRQISESKRQNNEQIEDLARELESLRQGLKSSQAEQQNLVQKLIALDQSTANKTQQIDQAIAQRTVGISLALLTALGLILGSYFMLRKRYLETSSDLSDQLKKALDNVRQTEENILKSDIQLAERLHELLIQLKQAPVATRFSKDKADHRLPLKLADEIHRMRKRLTTLPDGTKGLKSLEKSLERLEEELAEQGYEIVDHTGMQFDDNLSVKVRFIPSDDLEQGQSVITKVVTPQVNFDGVLIRMADVEVNVG